MECPKCSSEMWKLPDKGNRYRCEACYRDWVRLPSLYGRSGDWIGVHHKQTIDAQCGGKEE